jgi:Flp pilus assembly protein protease CpaA
VLIEIVVAAGLIYAAAVIQEMREGNIANSLCAGIAVLGLYRWAWDIFGVAAPGASSAAAWAVVVALVVFGTGVIAFSRGWFGGGSVKLITASAFLLGAGGTPAFLFLMLVIGALQGAMLIIHVKGGWVRGRALLSAGGPLSAGAKVPYAVATGLAAMTLILLQFQRA